MEFLGTTITPGWNIKIKMDFHFLVNGLCCCSRLLYCSFHSSLIGHGLFSDSFFYFRHVFFLLYLFFLFFFISLSLAQPQHPLLHHLLPTLSLFIIACLERTHWLGTKSKTHAPLIRNFSEVFWVSGPRSLTVISPLFCYIWVSPSISRRISP